MLNIKSESKKIKEIYKDNFWYAYRRNILRYIHNKYANEKSVILDLGSGIGVDKIVFQNAISIEKDIYSVQINEYDKLICGDANILPIKDNTFDIVSCMNVLEHENVNVNATMKELHRILKENGVIYINIPMFEFFFSTHDIMVKNGRRFNRVEFKRYVKKNKFDIEFISYWNFILIPFIFFRRKIFNIFETDSQSDIIKLPYIINKLFKLILFLEYPFFKKSILPFGISLFIVLRKK